MAPIRVIRVVRALKSSFLGVNPKGTVGELLALSTNSACCRFSAAQPGSVTKRTGPAGAQSLNEQSLCSSGAR